MVLRINKKYKKYIKNFDKYYGYKIISCLNYHIANKYNNGNLDLNYIYGRVDFYASIVKGRVVQGIWWLGDENFIKNADILSKCMYAFADIIRNPDLINDYDKGITNITNIVESMIFAKSFFEDIRNLMIEYFKSVMR